MVPTLAPAAIALVGCATPRPTAWGIDTLSIDVSDKEFHQRGGGVVYCLALLYTFLGVAMVSDIFMSGIERITSEDRAVTRKVEVDGKIVERVFHVRVWNSTIANLSLMALGSSAPEILLSVIEIVSNDFYAGELGPSTIVGSAAFNLMVIMAVCVVAIPAGEVRKIKYMTVFLVTAFFSIFAYLWLLFILLFHTPEYVDVWEGVLTFAFFPLLLLVSYAADKGWLGGAPITTGEARFLEDPGTADLAGVLEDLEARQDALPMTDQQISDLIEDQRPGITPISRYRRNNVVRTKIKFIVALQRIAQRTQARVAAQSAKVLPDGFELRASRSAGGPTAKSPESRKVSSSYDADELRESARVLAEQVSKDPLEAKDSSFDDDGSTSSSDSKTFATLLNERQQLQQSSKLLLNEAKAQIVADCLASSRAWPGAPGILDFYRMDEQKSFDVLESTKSITLNVVRRCGIHGEVSCTFRTRDGTAIKGSDYVEQSGMLTFISGEVLQTITIVVLDDNEVEEKIEKFYVHLEEATGGASFDPQWDGAADSALAVVHIIDDSERAGLAGMLMPYLNRHRTSAQLGTYRKQFIDAWDMELEDDQEPALFDWVFYALSLPWKLLFAVIPPPAFGGGWVCFSCALIFIGGLTAVIGDLATLLGDALNIKAPVTAITMVALGTSLPDLFASKSAAISDPHADAAIVNVTGSNSVNVFLGLGLPWMMAAVYWNYFASGEAIDGFKEKYGERVDCKSRKYELTGRIDRVGFVVKAGDLGLSVATFSTCALVIIATLIYRRKTFGGELGGPERPKYATAALFLSLWLVYIVVSSMRTYLVPPLNNGGPLSFSVATFGR
ncbi:Sodium/calcium exchanger protein-domain-containing protein [Pelagophyceae sp. CCMP2097]|nr:Sodium/calcium exchanger protein-domain-containing protein [Pelagophyceae sp. CCMP2097]|mmetsp:Transcript_9829/g.32406  ORF Transcript_9829/g.32406 Transcript_9829/m.32406 type:complete len:843 (-) Transcript_9829:96-2624(-)